MVLGGKVGLYELEQIFYKGFSCEGSESWISEHFLLFWNILFLFCDTFTQPLCLQLYHKSILYLFDIYEEFLMFNISFQYYLLPWCECCASVEILLVTLLVVKKHILNTF